MAKVKFNKKQLNKVIKNLESRFDEYTQDKKEINKAGEIIVREIKANARQGIGFDGESLPSITTGKGSWDERRKALASVNTTSRFYSPAKTTSTASFMGDTIEKITFKITGNKIVIFGKGNHKRIKGIRGGSLKGSNSPISEILSGLGDLGYKIIGASDKAKEQIRTNFIRFIRRKLR